VAAYSCSAKLGLFKEHPRGATGKLGLPVPLAGAPAFA